jgi:large-conductance mechanosensitive channel
MNGITLNIIAYALMALGAYFAFGYSIKQGTKITQTINYLILMWNVFMVLYLITDYENILSQPLNIRLNFYETITNFLLAAWLISFKFIKINQNDKSSHQV